MSARAVADTFGIPEGKFKAFNMALTRWRDKNEKCYARGERTKGSPSEYHYIPSEVQDIIKRFQL
jgi:hypothetical protein